VTEQRASGLADNPEAVDALKRSDMLVDLMFLLFSKEQFAIQDAGTRILTAVEPVELLARLFPTKEELRERVLSPGDVLLPFNSYVQRPVEITIEKGFITDIRGDLDAQMLKSYIQSFDDPRGYGMSHVGWGLNDLAQWHGMLPPLFAGGMGMEPRAVYGNVMFSIGPNNELGGPNDTACHFDIPMRDCSLFLDDEPVVVDGDVVVPEMQPLSQRR
jgi:hypothetical protein